MALERTEQSGLWAPMALVSIGGLTFSTLLTPILVPGLYLILEDLKGALRLMIQFERRFLHLKTVS